MNKIEKTKYAIFNPELGLFLSSDREYHHKNGQLIKPPHWTDQFNQIQVWSLSENALDGFKYVKHHFPNVYIVEVNLTMTWNPTEIAEVSVEDTPAYKKFLATYQKHLPAYRADVEAMPQKDWREFKAARIFLREQGYPVE